MMSTEKRPDLDRAVELAGELVEQLNLFLVSTTQSPEDLVANSRFEYISQCEYDSLLESYLYSDLDDRQVWKLVCLLTIRVGKKVGDAIRNSINCILTGAFDVSRNIECPRIFNPHP
jgi:hypothetical protein